MLTDTTIKNHDHFEGSIAFMEENIEKPGKDKRSFSEDGLNVCRFLTVSRVHCVFYKSAFSRNETMETITEKDYHL